MNRDSKLATAGCGVVIVAWVFYLAVLAFIVWGIASIVHAVFS